MRMTTDEDDNNDKDKNDDDNDSLLTQGVWHWMELSHITNEDDTTIPNLTTKTTLKTPTNTTMTKTNLFRMCCS